MAIDESIEGIIREETAQSKAVSTLIDVKKDKHGELGSDIELKTDLTADQINIHTAGDMLGLFLEMTEKKFSESANIMRQLIKLKERKSLSKDRKSRGEIVDIARNPDMNMMGMDGGGGGGGMVRRFLSPLGRRKRNE